MLIPPLSWLRVHMRWMFWKLNQKEFLLMFVQNYGNDNILAFMQNPLKCHLWVSNWKLLDAQRHKIYIYDNEDLQCRVKRVNSSFIVVKVDFLSWRIGPSMCTRFWPRYLYHHQSWPTFEILWNSHFLKCLFLSNISLSMRNGKLPKVYWWCLMNATRFSLFHQNRVKRINQRRGCLTDNLFF